MVSSRTDPPCADPACPVPRPTPEALRRLRTTVLAKGTILYRGHSTAHPNPSAWVPGRGDSRFAPIDGADHVYLARTLFAALLESALHEAAPPEPRIYQAQLEKWTASGIGLAEPLRLIDLRDPELDRLGLTRGQLVSTTPSHYRCTRTWAKALHGRAIGGHITHGLIWHSRQRELHALALDRQPALQDLVAEAPAEVIVLWSPPARAAGLSASPTESLGRLADGPGHDYVVDLANLLGIPVLEG